jgi:hypothetical protein
MKESWIWKYDIWAYIGMMVLSLGLKIWYINHLDGSKFDKLEWWIVPQLVGLYDHNLINWNDGICL